MTLISGVFGPPTEGFGRLDEAGLRRLIQGGPASPSGAYLAHSKGKVVG